MGGVTTQRQPVARKQHAADAERAKQTQQVIEQQRQQQAQTPGAAHVVKIVTVVRRHSGGQAATAPQAPGAATRSAPAAPARAAAPAPAAPAPAPAPVTNSRASKVTDRPDGTNSTALVPGCPGIEIDGGRILVPEGARLDLGGIGKGYAADLVAYELRTARAAGALVNLGGDVRVSGTPPTDAGWVVSVADPWQDGRDLVTLAVAEGAVATSSRLRRSWRRGGQEAHHLIDPRTGAPAADGIAAVTVVAQQAHWAEILAKAALIAGPDPRPDLLAAHGAAGLIALHDTTLLRCGGLERYETWTPSSGGTSPAPAG
ncbi:FAD:protein FMN transferase [Streptomyces sp. NPDC052101]|uniref:FAD:protein FMN transferase n=1 Tax=Streptomyces sp. NPDC052101 TaxID=3155763 RepID=UPI003439A696